MQLAELQAAFASALNGGDEQALMSCIVAGGAAAGRRLAAYRNNMHHNLYEALRATYPVVEQLVGQEFFDAVGRRYGARHPSTSGDLNGYGAFLPAFLQGFAPAAALAYLPDVARLEWAMHECLHAAEHAPLALERLGQVPAERHAALVFRLHPACRLLRSPYPVHRIWAWHQSPEGMLDIEGEGARLLLRRSGGTAECIALAEGDFVMLQALSEGQPLATAHARASTADAGCDLAAFMLRHVAEQTLVDFSVAGRTPCS